MTVLAPAPAASAAAARPAKPEPTTTTSHVSSHFLGSFFSAASAVPGAAMFNARPPMDAIAPRAAAPLRTDLLLTIFVASSYFFICFLLLYVIVRLKTFYRNQI